MGVGREQSDIMRRPRLARGRCRRYHARPGPLLESITEANVTQQPFNPPGDGLRRAIRWLSDQRRHDPAAIEEASLRFDLNPVEEEFLLAEARRVAESGHDDDG